MNIRMNQTEAPKAGLARGSTWLALLAWAPSVVHRLGDNWVLQGRHTWPTSGRIVSQLTLLFIAIALLLAVIAMTLNRKLPRNLGWVSVTFLLSLGAWLFMNATVYYPV